MVDAMTSVMENMDTSGHQDSVEVAEVIWSAATDGTDQLRYISGDGAVELLGGRYSTEQDEAFLAGMRKSFGL